MRTSNNFSKSLGVEHTCLLREDLAKFALRFFCYCDSYLWLVQICKCEKLQKVAHSCC